MTHSVPYISRQSAEDLQNSFARALAEPASYPVMFYIGGIGGVGKSTLKRRLEETYRQQADFTEVSFELTEGINTPIDLMVKLHAQLNPLPVWQKPMSLTPSAIWKKDLFEKDPFQALYDEYQQIANQLQTQPIEGKKSVDKEQIDQVKSLLKVGASALGDLMPMSGLSKPVLETTATTTVDIAGMLLTEKDRWQQVLQQHRATKKNKDLQALMLEPIPKLTKAFAEALVQRSQKTKKTVVLVLDTYEKVSLDLDRWLWQSLLANTELQPYRVRLVVAGTKSLLDEKAWRKLQQDRNLIFDRQLDRFDQSQTQKYLQDIGIKDEVEITAIFKVTKGLPYYLNWVRQQQEKGKPISFAQGNQGIVKLLLQGLNDKEKQALQIAACCRWFDRRLIQHLLAQQLELNWENGQSCYDWLIQREFVEPIQRFSRLDDVARDVFRESLWQESIEQFAQIHKILADYFNAQADQVIAPESHVSEKYASGDWCFYKSEALYYTCFIENIDIRLTWLTHLFESHYFRQHDVIRVPFNTIKIESEVEHYLLLSEKNRKFLSAIQPAIEHSWTILDEYPINNDELNRLNLSNAKLEITWQTCFSQINTLTGISRFAALIYKSKRSPKNQCLQWLQQAKELAGYLIIDVYPEFSSTLFAWNLGLTYYELSYVEEAIVSFDKAVEIKPDFYNAWYVRGVALMNLSRQAEAILSFDKALEFISEGHIWLTRGNALGILEKHEEAIISFNNALEISPDSYMSWFYRGLSLGILGRYEEAILSFDKSLQINSKDYTIWYAKACILSKLNKHEEAIISCNNALKLNPNDEKSFGDLGILLKILGKNEEAIYNFDRALEFNSNNHEILNSRGIALSNLGRYEEAITSYDQAIQTNPNEPNAYYNKSCAYSIQNQVELALENLQKAIQLDSWKYRNMVNTDSDFDNLRHDPRFQALIQ